MKNTLLFLSVFLSTSLLGQSVYIPDASFKAILVGNSAINTNGDTEIQMSEASSYNGGIECFGSNISDLTGVEAFTSLTGLFCTANNLTSLDVSQNVNLVLLHCGFNSITSLDLSALAALTALYAPGNLITSLNTDGAEALIHLDCSFNLITTLDLSQNTHLDHIDCQINHLQCLNIANGNNTNVENFFAAGNPNLSCVEVDDIVYAENHWQQVLQPIGSQFTFAFSVNCYQECSNCAQASNATDTKKACGSYTWIDGNTYTSSNNTATFNIAGGTVNGCDSLVTLDLTISNSVNGTDTQTACGSYTWIDGNTYTTTNNTAIFNIPGGAVNGCDSIISLDLTINPIPNNDVSQNDNTLTATQTVASYQWVDCDNENAIIIGEINQSFTTTSTGNYAVIVTINECGITSECSLIDFIGLGELNNTSKTLVKIVDMLGRETTFKTNTPLIYVYDDASTEKVFSVEY
tara:strand:+ start:2628 stop:4019 length:1392 start_codon:yes stop_codon:yes gene_type:complete